MVYLPTLREANIVDRDGKIVATVYYKAARDSLVIESKVKFHKGWHEFAMANSIETNGYVNWAEWSY